MRLEGLLPPTGQFSCLHSSNSCPRTHPLPLLTLPAGLRPIIQGPLLIVLYTSILPVATIYRGFLRLSPKPSSRRAGLFHVQVQERQDQWPQQHRQAWDHQGQQRKATSRPWGACGGGGVLLATSAVSGCVVPSWALSSSWWYPKSLKRIPFCLN